MSFGVWQAWSDAGATWRDFWAREPSVPASRDASQGLVGATVLLGMPAFLVLFTVDGGSAPSSAGWQWLRGLWRARRRSAGMRSRIGPGELDWMQQVQAAAPDPHRQSALFSEVPLAWRGPSASEAWAKLAGLEPFVRAEPARSEYYRLLARLEAVSRGH